MASRREPPAIGRHYSRKTKAQLIEELESLQDDMDELKHTFNEFKENHELAQDAAREVLWDWSEETGIINTSPGAWNKLGLADLPHQGPFEEWKEVIHPDDVDRYWAVLTAHLKGDTDQYENEYRIRQKDGGYGWVHDRGLALRDQNGRVYRMAGTISDITEQKQAKDALRAVQNQLQFVFDNAPLLIFALDRDGIFTLSRGAGLRAIGYEPDEVVGKSFFDLYKDRPDMCERARRALDGETFTAMSEFRGIKLSLAYAPVLNDRNQITGAIGVSIDITETAKLEEQLRQSQKMEAVGQLTGGIAHDFNNLLAVVLGNLEIAADELEGEEKARGLVNAAIRGAERGAELTHRLLAFSRKQVLRPKAIDLNAHIFGMTDLLRRTLGETIKIETKLADGLWRTVVDPGQIESAILNLAINARDAMPEGGKLTVETASMPFDDDYAAAKADVTPGDYVMVAVSDSGTGMTPEVMAHAFEPFFTTKMVRAGSGLGLSMVYGFVKQSGGHVTIYSELGECTTIKLYLPRTLDKPAADVPSVEAGTPVGQGEKILVIEDDTDVRTSVVALLSDLGYSVLEAKDGPAALAELDRKRGVNLVLTDVVLPGGLTGPQVASEIWDRHGAIPIIYMSGYPENAMVHHGKLDPGVILLQKPFRKADLARKVRQALGQPAILSQRTKWIGRTKFYN